MSSSYKVLNTKKNQLHRDKNKNVEKKHLDQPDHSVQQTLNEGNEICGVKVFSG